ncbi:metal-binding protein [Reyranella soli]|uniref:Metal-binding protein n=2 Tax=Reyranella soli TaxID=1230389 RepID=A0A512NEF7_9HYPH|nr:metal-binding protein [Reyranella soli]
MNQRAEINQKSELERVVDLDRMGPSGTALEIAPSDSERAALAKRFGFLSLPVFSARVTVDRLVGGQIVVEGRLRGRIVQACVLTLEPVNQDLDETFRIVFKPDMADDRDPESGEAVLNSQADAPEPLTGNMLDIGEIVAEQLSLAADPYPRRPGAKLEDVLPKPRHGGRKGQPEQRRHPFAGLAALRDKPRRGR